VRLLLLGAAFGAALAALFAFAQTSHAQTANLLYIVLNAEAHPTSSGHANPAQAFDISSDCSAVPPWAVARMIASARTSSGTFSGRMGVWSTGSSLIHHGSSTTFSLTTTYTKFDRSLHSPVDLQSACAVARAAGNTELWVGMWTENLAVRYYREAKPSLGAAQGEAGYLRTGSGTQAGYNFSMRVLGGASSIDWSALTFHPTTTSFFTASTSQALADAAAVCDDIDNIFARGLCRAGAFLFIPAPAVLERAALLPETAQDRFPFSVRRDFRAVVEAFGTTTAATSTIVIPFSTMSSTTAWLPDIEIFSEGTVRHFIPDAVWNALQALMVAVIWFGLVYRIYWDFSHPLRRWI